MGASTSWNPQGPAHACNGIDVLLLQTKRLPRPETPLCWFAVSIVTVCLSMHGGTSLRCHAGAIFRHKKNPKAATRVSSEAQVFVPSQNWKELTMAKYWNYWKVKTSWTERKALYTRKRTGLPCSM